MKKSIQNKIILLILVGIVFSSLTVGGLGIVSFRTELDKSVVSTMNLTCQEKAEELNNVLGRIEQSTEVLAVLATNRITSFDTLLDKEERDSYVEHMRTVAYDIVTNTKGAIGIYLRLNPEIAGPTEGFYWLESNKTGKLELEQNTNITQFAKDNIENVGWYYGPVEAGHAIWMDPYQNQNTNRKIVSYTMPIYVENQLVGVVGMDIDWLFITEMVDSLKVYDTGYAFLLDEDYEIEYSKELEHGIHLTDFMEELSHIEKSELVRTDKVYQLTINGQDKTASFKELCNGRFMSVIAPNKEINAGFHELVVRIVCLVLGIVFVFVFITIQIAKTIIRPLKALDRAAQELAKGYLDVDLNIHSNDEVGTVAQSLSETARQLKIKISYINSLAYSDKLTGVKNNTAYLQDIANLKNDISQRIAQFAIFVIDANGLKYINDNYGHEIGNELIIKVTQMIAEVFGEENVYRIGGDEFVVLLRDVTEEACHQYIQKFDEVVENQKGKIWASASIGHAVYSKKMDSTYESVFNRADEDMYEKKVQMKAKGKTSRMLE